MADTPPSNPAPAPAPGDHPQRNRSIINQEWLDELSDADQLVTVALEPAYATLVIDETRPTFLADLQSDIATARTFASRAVQKSTGKMQATGDEEVAKQTLLDALAVIQKRARQKYSGNDKAAIKGYFIGTDIGASRSLLEQSAKTILDKLQGTENSPADKLPGIGADKIDAVVIALSDYKGSQTGQTDQQGEATTLRKQLDQILHSKNGIVARCRQLRFAADAEYPHTDPVNAGTRAKFGLPMDRALRA